jgi:hypothetical protein
VHGPAVDEDERGTVALDLDMHESERGSRVRGIGIE